MRCEGGGREKRWKGVYRSKVAFRSGGREVSALVGRRRLLVMFSGGRIDARAEMQMEDMSTQRYA